jgi:hypothetical protein
LIPSQANAGCSTSGKDRVSFWEVSPQVSPSQETADITRRGTPEGKSPQASKEATEWWDSTVPPPASRHAGVATGTFLKVHHASVCRPRRVGSTRRLFRYVSIVADLAPCGYSMPTNQEVGSSFHSPVIADEHPPCGPAVFTSFSFLLCSVSVLFLSITEDSELHDD